MKKIMILLSIVILFANCSQNLSVNKNKQHITTVANKIVTNKDGENFNSFLEYFKSDSIFQLERNIIPFVQKTEVIVDTNTGMEKDTVILSNDKLLFKTAFWLKNQSLTIKIGNDTVNISYPADINNFKFKTYQYFLKDHGKWYYNSGLQRLRRE